MHPLFRTGDPLPVAPGESPFHVRGLYLDRLVARLKREGGGLARFLDAVPDTRVSTFFQQKFTWTSWYDLLPVMPLYRAIAHARGLDFETAVYSGTRLGAAESVPSLFRLALRAPGRAALAGVAAQIVIHNTDFTHLGVQRFTDTGVTAAASGIPLYAAPHVANLVRGFFQTILELRGGEGVQTRYTDVVKDGAKGGFETVTVHYEFSWTRLP